MLALMVALSVQVPHAIHVGVPDDPTHQVAVTWRTDGPADPSVRVDGRTVRGVTHGPAEPGLGQSWYHDVLVDGLAPGAAYDVVLGGARIIQVRTWPVEADHARIVARGDIGTTDHARRLARVEAEAAPDLAIYLGDWSYANYGSGLETQQEPADPRPWWAIWDAFFGILEPVLVATPGAFVLGNHEYADLVAGPNELGPLARIHAPGNERRYVVRYGGLVSIVVYDSFLHTRAKDRDLAGWIDRTLAGLRAADPTGWIIVAAHHPLVGRHGKGPGEPSQERQRALLAPIFQRWDVALVLAGHIHCHQRSYPIAWRNNRWVREDEAPIYMTIGTGGVGQCGDSPGWAHAAASAQYLYATAVLDVTADEIEVRIVAENGQTVDEGSVIHGW